MNVTGIPAGWDKPEAYVGLWEKHGLKPEPGAYIMCHPEITTKPCGCLVGALWLEVTGKSPNQWDASMYGYKDLVMAGWSVEFIDGLDIGFTDCDPTLREAWPQDADPLFRRGVEIGVAVRKQVKPVISETLYPEED